MPKCFVDLVENAISDRAPLNRHMRTSTLDVPKVVVGTDIRPNRTNPRSAAQYMRVL